VTAKEENELGKDSSGVQKKIENWPEKERAGTKGGQAPIKQKREDKGSD